MQAFAPSELITLTEEILGGTQSFLSDGAEQNSSTTLKEGLT